MSETETSRRTRSRLEKDDPKHCRNCGIEIKHDGFTDHKGRPVSWVAHGLTTDGPGWEPIERCRDCWVKHHIQEIESEAEERYPAGDGP